MIVQVELGFDNGVVDDIFFASGYDIRGHVVAQVYFANIHLISSFRFLSFDTAEKEFNITTWSFRLTFIKIPAL